MPTVTTQPKTRPLPDDRSSRRGYALTPVGWVPSRDLDLSEWSSAGRSLSGMVRASQWWLGDWIRYGNAMFGEKYSRASNLTGYDIQTLMIMVHVAGRYPAFRRRKDVSWSHHAALASLEPAEQDRWLDECSRLRLSVADVRQRLREEGVGPRRERTESPPPAELTDGMLACPHCGKPIQLQSTEGEGSQ